MPLLASPTSYVSVEERMARERNSGVLPYLDLVEHIEGNASQLVQIQAEDRTPRRGRRPTHESE